MFFFSEAGSLSNRKDRQRQDADLGRDCPSPLSLVQREPSVRHTIPGRNIHSRFSSSPCVVTNMCVYHSETRTPSELSPTFCLSSPTLLLGPQQGGLGWAQSQGMVRAPAHTAEHQWDPAGLRHGWCCWPKCRDAAIQEGARSPCASQLPWHMATLPG